MANEIKENTDLTQEIKQNLLKTWKVFSHQAAKKWVNLQAQLPADMLLTKSGSKMTAL